MNQPSGYLHPLYAESFSEWAQPRRLPQSGGWILSRPIEGTGLHDAMGCYPLFACSDWRALEHDLRANGDGLVSLAIVTDSFADVDEQTLRRSFDVVRPFKTHFVMDLQEPLEQAVSDRHLRNVKACSMDVDVQVEEQPIRCLDAWLQLYDNLIRHHDIRDMRAFSRESFEKQLRVPGAVMFLGSAPGGEIVSAILAFISGDKSYIHLCASSDEGYRLKASFCLYWESLRYLGGRGVRWCDFGAGAGLEEHEDGLGRFKQGWTNTHRQCWLCGKILNPDAYDSLCRDRGIESNDYFPAYRAGEFA